MPLSFILENLKDFDTDKPPASKLSEALKELLAAGVRRIEADFSGSGDSGDMYAITYRDTSASINYPTSAVSLRETEFFRLVEEFFSEKCTCDWYNDEGGGGELVLHLDTMSYSLTSYQNETIRQEHDDTSGSLEY